MRCKESVETALQRYESIPSLPRTYLAGYHRRYHGGDTSKGITAATSQVVAQNGLKKSGRHDLNMRPLRPERSALARLSYAPILGLRYRAFCQSRMRASLRCPKAIREKRLF